MGCCIFTLLLFGASRLADVLWWIVQPNRWSLTFASFPGAYWIWPFLGIIFLPWTTLMYVVVYPAAPGDPHLTLINWLFLVLAFIVDIGSYGSGWRANAART